GIRIEHQLVRIEAQPEHGLVRPVHAVAVDLPRACLRQVAMPDLVGALVEDDSPGFVAAFGVEQAELDLQCVAGEECEIDALAVPGRAQRIRPARPRTFSHRRSPSAPRTPGGVPWQTRERALADTGDVGVARPGD